MKSEGGPPGRPATTVIRARSVAAVAADARDADLRRAAFVRLRAHLRRRHGRIHFDESHRGIAA